MTLIRRALIAIFLGMLVFSGTAGGIVVENTNLTPAEVNLLFAMREYTLTYNGYADRLPGWLTGPFENEMVDLHVESPDGVLVVGITFQDRKIVQFDAKSCPNPIITVTTDAATVKKVMASARPFDTFRAAMRNGTIMIEGNNILGVLRAGMIGFGLWMMDIIGF